jgi:hypothetical protein
MRVVAGLQFVKPALPGARRLLISSRIDSTMLGTRSLGWAFPLGVVAWFCAFAAYSLWVNGATPAGMNSTSPQLWSGRDVEITSGTRHMYFNGAAGADALRSGPA